MFLEWFVLRLFILIINDLRITTQFNHWYDFCETYICFGSIGSFCYGEVIVNKIYPKLKLDYY